MPTLNWDIFSGLPGSAEKNFELLCRGIVRLTFGSYGVFRALANQPGVEFHLNLDKRCDPLGNAGRWWGWQCKWYDLPANGALGTTRRKHIKDGLRKAERHILGLTDWVLWTRRALTKSDQTWFNNISSKMTLHLWTGDDINNLLSGQTAVLRNTYFGELVLTPDVLREQHSQAVASIRSRWQPDVHHVGEAERALRRMLGEFDSWAVLGTLSSELRATAEAVKASPPVPPLLASAAVEVTATSTRLAEALDSVAECIRRGDLDLLRDELSSFPRTLPADVATAPRKLRSRNCPAGLYATNAVATCTEAIRIIRDIEASFSSRVVAVLAPAGCGKTHLSAQLTSATPSHSHGVLLHGRELHATYSLDDLARRVSIAAQPVPSMESLLAAVDAAGQRAHHRLPVFIDGLNESEDPRQWKRLLATLEATLANYPYVLLVCTLRPAFAEDVLPAETRRVEIEDYGEETFEAVQEHFRYWKIDATDASLLGRLRHPLTLRLFCEVTNPSRRQVVGVNSMPGSLSVLFERYLEQVSVRVCELAPRAHRFYAHDVNVAISTIANMLWESRSRSVASVELRNILGDAQRPWDQSIVRALEHEGILLRMPSGGIDAYVPVNDLLGGHIIANALLAKYGQRDFETWLRDSSTTPLLAGDYDVRHPLADDVVVSLVGQLPRRFHAKQLWQLVDDPLRGEALRLAARLDPASLDAVTVDALLTLVRTGDASILSQLREVRGTPGHPLNAEALDRTLRTMTVADRDLRWTEWLRLNKDDVHTQGHSILLDLEHLEKRWRSKQVCAGDQLRARWVMWTLTSTVRRLRDQATRALYWFGRVDPEGLFELTIDSLAVNDAYVSERMLAASYGIVMSHQQEDSGFAAHLKPFLEQLSSSLVGAPASAPTHHYLARIYVRGIVDLAAKFYASCLPPSMCGTWSFGQPSPIQALVAGSSNAYEADQALRTDFVNYTLGGLFNDRRNYDMSHAGHQAAVAHVRGVVWTLGWRNATFAALDRNIEEEAYRHGRGHRPLAESYGKKYGWTGFFTYAGVLEEKGLLPDRRHDFSGVDIDPSFPEKPPADGKATIPDVWLLPGIKEHKSWLCEATTSLPSSLIRREFIGSHRGPWLAINGFVTATDRVLGREAWAFISAFVTDKTSAPWLRSALNKKESPWRSPDVPSDHYIFANEIPWHPNFAYLALEEDAYHDKVCIGKRTAHIETLAHQYAWEGYHSEMNRAGRARVPSKLFSTRLDLRGAPQTFDQFLPDGTRATITLSSVDGLDAEILYIREDLLRQYVGKRAIVWYAFGERELRPYPLTPPDWLINMQERLNVWHQVWTDADILKAQS